VAEINPAYDWIPGFEKNTTRKGPGWIYVSNLITDYDEAAAIALLHHKQTGLKTRIDTI
jgi:hypothetical protein